MSNGRLCRTCHPVTSLKMCLPTGAYRVAKAPAQFAGLAANQSKLCLSMAVQLDCEPGLVRREGGPSYGSKGLSCLQQRAMVKQAGSEWTAQRAASAWLAYCRTDLRDNAFHNLAHFRIAKPCLCLPLKLRVRYLHVPTHSLGLLPCTLSANSLVTQGLGCLPL